MRDQVTYTNDCGKCIAMQLQMWLLFDAEQNDIETQEADLHDKLQSGHPSTVETPDKETST